MIQDNYIHDLRNDVYFDPHFDGLQIGPGTATANNVITHNNFDLGAGANACIMIEEATNIDITYNRFNGGGYNIYFEDKANTGRMTDCDVIGNVFVHNVYGDIAGGGADAQYYSGNVYGEVQIIAPVPGDNTNTINPSNTAPTTTTDTSAPPVVTTDSGTGGDHVMSDGTTQVGTATANTSAQSDIAELYAGYFNRAPDAAGLDYWTNRHSQGMTIGEIAQSFSAQPESHAQYSYLSGASPSSASEFINEIYNNLFGSDAEPAGLNYWVNDLQHGMPPGHVVLAMINGASETDAIALRNQASAGVASVLDEVDTTSGTAFNDDLTGHSGTDRMDGGAGNDSLTGAGGNDVFVFAGNFGRDVITDFGAGSESHDVVEFSRTAFDDFADVMALAAQQGADVVIDAGGGNALTLKNTSLSSLDRSDFHFA